MRLPSILPTLACLLVCGPGAAAGAMRPVPTPDAQAIQSIRLFEEPLIPFGGAPSAEENASLSKALESYRAQGDGEAVGPLLAFLDANPHSPWRPALLTDLGLVYRRTGYFVRALDAWEEAWRLCASRPVEEGAAFRERLVSELAELLARLGRKERLERLLKEAERMELHGSARERISLARNGLWLMEHRPEKAYRCGPLGLAMMSGALGHTSTGLLEEPCTPQGTSLAYNCDLAKKYGLDLQTAKRSPGASMPIPALVHWKAGHFAALVASRDGRYQMKDPTFGNTYWVSARALDEEASGYALIPHGPMPEGWQAIAPEEAQTVWGRGATGPGDPDGTAKGDVQAGGDCSSAEGMPKYSFHASVVSLHITDIPLRYHPPRGPDIAFEVTYNQREYSQPQTFTYSNLGHLWSHNWLSYIEYIEGDTVGNTNQAILHAGGGGQYIFGYTTAGALRCPLRDGERLVLEASGAFTLFHKDGSKSVYGQVDQTISPHRAFLTQEIDAQGNAVTLFYDSLFRLLTVKDALGRATSLHYDLPSDNLKITKVVDPFNRTASFTYNDQNQLTSITDMLGLSSQFGYGSVQTTSPTLPQAVAPAQTALRTAKCGPAPARVNESVFSTRSVTRSLALSTAPSVGPDFIASMTTPYGTTTFQAGEVTLTNGSNQNILRWIQAMDPSGNTEKLQSFTDVSPFAPDFGHNEPNPATDLLNVPDYPDYLWRRLVFRNSFYWNKRAMAAVAADGSLLFTTPHVFHWLHTADGNNASRLLESEKDPLENRIWYRYAKQREASWDGTFMGGIVNYDDGSNSLAASIRQLDDGQLQIKQTTYNDNGNPTAFVDSLGRTTSLTYSPDGMDLLQVRQTTSGQNDLLASYTYNAQHLPVTFTNAAGQKYSISYNPWGQPTALTNPKNETVSLNYDAQGFLSQVQGPGGVMGSYTYDAFGRVQTKTLPQGYSLAYEYDAMDRPTKLTFPDGTMNQWTYDRLDLAAFQDRQGRPTTFHHNALRQLTDVTDPLGRITRYGWCGCGAELESLTDPAGHMTTWTRDLQGRVTGKSYDNGATEQRAYEPATSRLIQRTDPSGQITRYAYALDDRTLSISYPNATHRTPTVSYTYDAIYPRLNAMGDGIGTTTFTYNPIGATPALGAGRLASVQGPWPNAPAIQYQYDALDRVIQRTTTTHSESWSYDSLGRVASATNPLGTFTYGYLGLTNSPTQVKYPNGQQSNLAYGAPAEDLRLKSVQHVTASGANLSSFSYTFGAGGALQALIQQWGTQDPRTLRLSYDAAEQLLGVAIQNSTGTPLDAFTYAYDLGGNRTQEVHGGLQRSSSYDRVNQLIQRGAATPAP